MICANCQTETDDTTCSSCGGNALLDERYRLDALVGEGGSGITYRATRMEDARVVCVKELVFGRMADFEAEKLFEREAHVLRQLHHPGIPEYFDDFCTGSGRSLAMYLVQEFVDGVNLSDEMQDRRYTEPQVLDILDELLGILSYLQELRPPVIHRDIKPSNIMRHADDGRLVLVDFGAVRDAARNAGAGGSTVAGTFGYMAPEQFYGKATCETDLYGVGVLATVLLSQLDPTKMLDDDQQFAWQDYVEVRPSTRRLLEQLLEHNPQKRPENATRARAMVRECQQQVEKDERADAAVAPVSSPAPARPGPDVRSESQPRQPDAPVSEEAAWARKTEAMSEAFAPVHYRDMEETKREMTALPARVKIIIIASALVVTAILIGGFLSSSAYDESTYDAPSNPSEVNTVSSDHPVHCMGGHCVGLNVPFKSGLKFGMSFKAAKKARAELKTATVLPPKEITSLSFTVGVASASVKVPGKRVRAKFLVAGQPAKCTLAFAVHNGLSRIDCKLDAPSDGDQFRQVQDDLVRLLKQRYGQPQSTLSGQTGAVVMDDPSGTWTWSSPKGTLTVKSQFFGGLPGMKMPVPVPSIIEVRQQIAAYGQLIDDLRQKADNINAKNAAKKKRQRSEQRQRELQHLKKLNGHDKL